MESEDRCSEVQWFVDVAICFVDVDVLSFVDAVVDPSVADWLNLDAVVGITAKSIYQFGTFRGIF